MSDALILQAIQFLAELLRTIQKVNPEQLEAAIEKCKATGGDTSDVERVLKRTA